MASGKYNVPNIEYWQQRAEERINRYWKDTDRLNARLKKEFSKSLKEIQKEITYFYSRYGKDNVVTYANATRGGKITRLQGLMKEIESILAGLESTQQISIADLLTNITTDNYYRTIHEIQKGLNLGFSFTLIDKKAVEEIIKYQWSGEMFSERIHENTRLLSRQVKQTLTRGFIRGESNQKMAENINQVVGSGYKNCLRVATTESSYVANKSSFLAYEECGIEQYQLLATLDNRTSLICQGLDGSIFYIDEASVGTNYPPLHPYCRTTTIPYVGYGIRERIAKNKSGRNIFVDGNITYEDWYKENVDNKTSKKSYDSKLENNLQNAIKNVSNQLNINEFINEINQYYKSGNEKVLMIHEKQMEKLKYSEGDSSYHLFGGVSLRRPNKMITKRNKLGNKYLGTLFHETGHGEDFMFFANTVGDFNKYMKNSLPMNSSYYYMKEATKKDKTTLIKLITNEECNELKRYIMHDGKMNEALSDICVAITNGKLSGTGEHTAKYFKDKGKVQSETFANLTAIYTKGDEEAISLIEKYFPNINKEYFNLIEDMIKENHNELMKRIK